MDGLPEKNAVSFTLLWEANLARQFLMVVLILEAQRSVFVSLTLPVLRS